MLDERTQKYLEATQWSIGLLGYNAGWEDIRDAFKKAGIRYEEVAHMYLPGLLGPEMAPWEVEIFSYQKDGQPRWAAQWGYRTDIDDYVIKSLIFTRLPSAPEIETGELLERIKLEFELGRVSPTFQCWECGQEAHWLDGGQLPLQKRWDRLLEKYCGC